MAAEKKSHGERPVLPPVDFHPPSNGEYCPKPPTARAYEARAMWRRIVDEKSRRLGVSRRAFAESACGTAAALFVLNQLGCSDGSGTMERSDAAPSPDGGVVGRDVAGYDVDADMLEDADKARERLSGDEFIFDVQTHVSQPLEPWPDKMPPERALDFIKLIFVQSDTTVACVSGVPFARTLGVPNVAARVQFQEMIDRFAGPRLLLHANAEPERGAAELDYMAEVTSKHKVNAWKTYPHQGAKRLDSDDLGGMFLAQAEKLGVKVVASHRGISGGGGYEVAGSPVDVVRAAKKFPNIKFLIYHAGWEDNAEELAPYSPANANPRGVDRLIRALEETGIGPNGNVYAELGSTWKNLIPAPNAAAHVLGKLLKHLGPNRIVWGTDCVFHGTPQTQITAMRTFVIPTTMQDMYGYPALTPAIRRRIFGENAAEVYGVDPAAVRYVIKDDDIETLRTAYRLDPRSVPLPHPCEYTGPRSRRQFLAFLERERRPG